jgi:hypothetical protein
MRKGGVGKTHSLPGENTKGDPTEMRNLKGVDLSIFRLHIEMGGLINVNLVAIDLLFSKDSQGFLNNFVTQRDHGIQYRDSCLHAEVRRFGTQA